MSHEVNDLQAVVLEGKYWKRKFDAVATEYRKWRFYREKTVSLTYLVYASLAYASVILFVL